MKRIFLQLFLVFCVNFAIGQTNHPDNINFAIGLPKVSITQLESVKTDLKELRQIASAEFVFGDNLLLIETKQNMTRVLTYADVEAVLLKYFNSSDIYIKDATKFEDLKLEYVKHDKFVIK